METSDTAESANWETDRSMRVGDAYSACKDSPCRRVGITAACAFVGMVSPHAERLSDTVLDKTSEVNVTPSANIDDDDDDDDDDEVSPPTMSSVAATSSG